MTPSFIEFVNDLKVPLSPAQRTFARIAFDGVEPAGLADDELEIALAMFGDLAAIPPSARKTVVAVFGRNSGKTSLSSTRALHVGLFHPVALAPGERGFVYVVAPTLALAQQAVDLSKGLVESSDRLSRRIVESKRDAITLRRPDGKLVTLTAVAAGRGGTQLRGKTILALILDECAFFRDEQSGVVNDADLFAAALPRLRGQAILISTPWLQSGLFHDLHEANHGKPTTALVARAKTELMRADDPDTLAIVAAERARDPDNARREFDCEWLPAGAGGLFLASDLERAVGEPSAETPKPRAVAVGADLGFVRDATALVAVAKFDGRLEVLDAIEMRPAKNRALQVDEVARTAADFAGQFDQRTIHCDGHSAELMRQHCANAGVRLSWDVASESPIDREKRWLGVRDELAGGRLRIPKSLAWLATQLGNAIAAPRSGGGHTFSFPRRAGSHCDGAAALILAAGWHLHDDPIERQRRQLRSPALQQRLARAGFGGRGNSPAFQEISNLFYPGRTPWGGFLKCCTNRSSLK